MSQALWHAASVLLAVLSITITAVGSRASAADSPTALRAFITSEHAVYTVGEPVDVNGAKKTIKAKALDGAFECVVSNPLTISVHNRAHRSYGVTSLRDVWALNMPGTRPMNLTMRGDPPTFESSEGPLLAEILGIALKYDPGKHPIAEAGFAVRGEGMEALQEAHAVLVRGKAKTTTFSKDEKISLVFFSYSFGAYVHLVNIEQRNTVIQLSYRFVPHRTREMTAHLALIPVRKPPKGSVRVEVKPQIGSTASALDWGEWAQKIVCGSFVFTLV